MPANEEEAPGAAKPVGILLELRVPKDQEPGQALRSSPALAVPGFDLDPDYTPVPVSPPPEDAAALEGAGQTLLLVRGTIDPDRIADLEAQDGVARVWRDTPIEPFAGF